MPRGRYPIAKLAKDYDRVVVQKGLCELPDDGHKPLVTVLSFSSLGFRTAMSSPLSASLTAHVLSTPEYSYFVSLHADRTVLRIACQHALNPAETLAIAEELGLDHPAIFSGSETIMSTDFMVLNSTSAVPTWRAVAVKRQKDLDRRTLQKLEIERVYWQRRGVKWTLVLDTFISKIVVRNIEMVWRRYDRASLPCDNSTTDAVILWLYPRISAGKRAFAPTCLACDAEMGLQPGTALAIAYHAIISGIWPVDFRQPFLPNQPLPLLPSAP